MIDHIFSGISCCRRKPTKEEEAAPQAGRRKAIKPPQLEAAS
uniref:Uncharacterized protein n=1 Tax=Arundo donax TaxID=35708 RepID=A0A0A8XNT0_ARUDO